MTDLFAALAAGISESEVLVRWVCGRRILDGGAFPIIRERLQVPIEGTMRLPGARARKLIEQALGWDLIRRANRARRIRDD